MTQPVFLEPTKDNYLQEFRAHMLHQKKQRERIAELEAQVERLEWENKGIEEWRAVAQQLAEENQKLQNAAPLTELLRELAHWKANHACEIRRSRLLKERPDMPIERVRAYEQWGLDQAKIAGLTAACEAVVAAHSDLFGQCCSNPITNTWGEEVKVSKLNEAAHLARSALKP